MKNLKNILSLLLLLPAFMIISTTIIVIYPAFLIIYLICNIFNPSLENIFIKSTDFMFNIFSKIEEFINKLIKDFHEKD